MVMTNIIRDKLKVLYSKWLADLLVLGGVLCTPSIAEQINSKAEFLADNILLNNTVNGDGLLPILRVDSADFVNGQLNVITQNFKCNEGEGNVIFVDSLNRVHYGLAGGVVLADSMDIQGTVTERLYKAHRWLVEGD